MNLLEVIPSELLHIIAGNLTFNEIVKLEKVFHSQVDYEQLLRNEYPSFWRIIKTIKEKDDNYYHYQYSKAWDDINVECLLLDYRDLDSNDLRNGEIVKFLDFVNHYDSSLIEIRAAYYTIDAGYIEYKYLFPNVPNINMAFFYAIQQLKESDDIDLSLLESDEYYHDYLLSFVTIYMFKIIKKKSYSQLISNITINDDKLTWLEIHHLNISLNFVKDYVPN
jgi:hypothetical protein